MASKSQRVVVITGASRGLGVRAALEYLLFCKYANQLKLEWVRQLSQDPENSIIAVVRNPDKADLLTPLLGSRVVSVQGDVADNDSFLVGSEFRLHVGQP
jgi:NAD(P)-dependent dehydrogenase (short-subunit alcohol dehydrogenase family)